MPTNEEVVLNTSIIVSSPTLTVNVEENTLYENDYTKLINKPSLNGVELIGNIEELDPNIHDWARQESKPAYTPEELGARSISIEELSQLFTM